jgi:capsular polysaccharide biosynthesis protein
MPIGWFKKTIRPRLIALVRRRIGSTRRGPVQAMETAATWIAAHPKEGRFLAENPLWFPPAAVPRNHAAVRHSAFQPENFQRQWGNFVAEIREAYVTGPSLGVITPNRRLIQDVSIEFGHWPHDHGSLRRLLFPRPRRLPGRWALLATTGGNSYYHHMTEVLPKFAMLREAGVEPGDLAGWIVNGVSHPYQKESWNRLGLPPARIRTTGKGAYYHCESLVIPSLPAMPGSLRKETPDFLRSLFGWQPSPQPCRLIYLHRKNTPARQLLDEGDLWRRLAPLGFEKIRCESMSVAEQARLFAGAKVVVGPHGGGMTNLVFAPAGCGVVEIFSPRYVNSCYWRLAWAAGLSYAYVLGEAPAEGPDSAPAGDALGHIRLGSAGLRQVTELVSAMVG